LGARYEFTCPKCGYRAEVSGSLDCGFQAVSITVLCEDCKELLDVFLEDIKSYELPSGWTPDKVDCPVSKDHVVRIWEYPDECPRCRSQMKRQDITVMWD